MEPRTEDLSLDELLGFKQLLGSLSSRKSWSISRLEEGVLFVVLCSFRWSLFRVKPRRIRCVAKGRRGGSFEICLLRTLNDFLLSFPFDLLGDEIRLVFSFTKPRKSDFLFIHLGID